MTRIFRWSALPLTAVLMLGGCSTRHPALSLQDRIPLGRDLNNDRCRADRVYRDAQLTKSFDAAYTIACGGVTASKALGRVSSVRTPVAEDDAACGPESQAQLAGVGSVRARRCFDQAIGAETVVIAFERGGLHYRGASLASVQGPMERALKTLAGLEPVATAGLPESPVSLKSEPLAAAPERPATALASSGADPLVALREGSLQNRLGRFVDSSRLLSDALSRLPETTPVSERIEINLEAGLADSNLRLRESAAANFEEAGRLLAQNPGAPRHAFLDRKRAVYLAQDALNRRDWRGAVAALGERRAESPLENPAVLAELNRDREGGGGFGGALAGSNAETFSQLYLDAQRGWALSVARYSVGGLNALQESRAALALASANIRAMLDARLNPTPILGLTAQIERQAGRLDVQGAQGNSAGVQAGVAKFDCALAALQGQTIANESQCAVGLTPQLRARLVRSATSASDPIVAETQLERAALLARVGAPEALVSADYDRAIETMIASERTGGTPPAGLESYLDLLAAQSKTGANAEAGERFFRTVQALGEASTAREYRRLQSVITSDPKTGAKVQERTDTERELQAIRFSISTAANDAARAPLERQRSELERRREQLTTELQGSRFAALDDRPATIADIQASLNPGEVYWKLAALRTRLYGMTIAKDAVTIYPVERDLRSLSVLGDAIRRSIIDDTDKIPVFNVGASAALYRFLAGPAAAQIAGSRSLIVDVTAPLDQIPAGVLVTDIAAAQAYRATSKAAPYDFTRVPFLAKRASLQTALSPRSFLISRNLPASRAARTLVGLGDPLPVQPAQLASAQTAFSGTDCSVVNEAFVQNIVALTPISADRITVVADAMGEPGAARITGASFTDKAMERSDQLDDYKVLHFSTHGLPQVRVGCTEIPASLITSVGDDGSDGFLTYEEIALMKLDANLVVLAACDTYAGVSGRSSQRSGSEGEGSRALSGLVRSFLAANARAVLATSWQVSIGAESDDLFREFYRRGRTEAMADALRDAQGSLMAKPRYSHPFYWAAYFIVGDASKNMLATGAAATAAMN